MLWNRATANRGQAPAYAFETSVRTGARERTTRGVPEYRAPSATQSVRRSLADSLMRCSPRSSAPNAAVTWNAC